MIVYHIEFVYTYCSVYIRISVRRACSINLVYTSKCLATRILSSLCDANTTTRYLRSLFLRSPDARTSANPIHESKHRTPRPPQAMHRFAALHDKPNTVDKCNEIPVFHVQFEESIDDTNNAL